MLGHRTLNTDDYLAIAERRGWIVLIPAIIFPILAIAATFYLTPQYVSKTEVLIDQQKVPEDLVKPVVTEDIDSRLASMKEEILSRSTIQPIVEKYNLFSTQHLSMDDRIAMTRSNIDIKQIQSDIAHDKSPGFDISFTANDAHTAQMVCSEITSLFTAANLRSREAAAEGTTDFLKEQLDNAKQTLDDQDAKLAHFKQQYFGMLPEDEGNNINILASLNTQLEASNQALSRLDLDKSYLQSLLEQQLQTQATASTGGASVVVAPQVQEKELEDLLAQQSNLTSHYTADHPDVIAINRKIANLRKKMQQSANPADSAATEATPGKFESPAVQDLRSRIRSANLDIQTKRNEQAQLNQQIRLYQTRIQSTPQVEEQFKQLTRDTMTSQEVYDGLLAKLNMAQEATDLEHRQQGETFHVQDEANLPDSPIYPKRRVFAMGGLGAGLGLGLLIVALLEYLDTAVRSERDIWAFTKLPTLASIEWSAALAGSKPVRPAKPSRLRRLFTRKPPSTPTQPSAPLQPDDHV